MNDFRSMSSVQDEFNLETLAWYNHCQLRLEHRLRLCKLQRSEKIIVSIMILEGAEAFFKELIHRLIHVFHR